MKITYIFSNETIEIEVPDTWGHIIVEFDRNEYNLHHKETRRHISLDAFESEPMEFKDPDNPIDAMFEEESLLDRLPAAIAKLDPEQQWLIHEIFFKGRKKSDVAAEMGINPAAVSGRLSTIYKKIKLFLK
ncbi:MAG: sigma-70 family RNA polymerase sigma factor [Clostridia bacterium]|nr:sigma-70 family RNA polymerase sigma factor [Clostridia bacterium]